MKDRLYLGAARADITPEIGCHLYGYNDTTFSESIHDRLDATAYAFSQGGKKALLVTLTLCEVNTRLYTELRREISALCGVPFENIILCATHTHSGPNVVGNIGWGDLDMDYYEKIMHPQVIKAVKQAFDTMVPVRMGIGTGLSDVGINRRELTVNNEIGLGQNPWGPYNPVMTVLSFRDDEDKTVANIVHYGCHGTAAGRNTEITRDWSGIMCDRLQALTGGLTSFFNGPEGDVGPRLTNGRTTANIKYVEELGGKAAQDAMAIYNTIRDFHDAELAAGSGDMIVPLSPRISVEEAKAGLAKYDGKTVNIDGQRAAYYRRVLKSYEDGYEEIPSKSVPQTIVKVGGAAFVTFPYELFSEIGMRVSAYSKFPHVLSLSNANGCEGYFPTQDQLCRGGYEIGMFQTTGVQTFTDDADFALVTETLKNMEEI